MWFKIGAYKIIKPNKSIFVYKNLRALLIEIEEQYVGQEDGPVFGMNHFSVMKRQMRIQDVQK